MARCGCWRHRAQTVWVWQQSAECLPAPGAYPATDLSPEIVALLRALATTGLLLIEAPQSAPLFHARFARNKRKSPTPPAFARIIDRLQLASSLCNLRGRAIALLDQGNDTTGEDRARLSEMSSDFGVFARHEDAMRWLLEKAPLLAARFASLLHRQAPSPKKATVKKSGVAPGTLFPASETEECDPAPDPQHELVRLADLGGSVGRHMLARLHLATWRAMQAKARGKKIALPAVRWSGIKLLADCANDEGLRYGRVQQLREHVRDGAPVAGSFVPAWSGYMTRWWRGAREIKVELEGTSAAGAADKAYSLVIGVGTSRLFGERDLAELLEKIWRVRLLPAAIISHEEADEKLLRWVRREFPQAREFPDSLGGGMRALEAAFQAAHEHLRA
jgi:hypothetical protein